jgi:DNA replicative helicase MCM subunit Mcm2 (Cdc46/Mcm family)
MSNATECVPSCRLLQHRSPEPHLLQTIAKHVMNVHMNRPQDNAEADDAEIDVEKMKRFIAYCKLYVPMRSDPVWPWNIVDED